MRKLTKVDNKVKNIKALLNLFMGGHISEDVYFIKKSLEPENTTPDVILWMSSYDFRSLLILANGSRVSVLEVDVNTLRWRNEEDLPSNTEKYKYVVVG